MNKEAIIPRNGIPANPRLLSSKPKESAVTRWATREWQKFVDHYKEYAQAEGWDIFHCEGSDDGWCQIQRIDDSAILKDDTEAWEIVANGEMPHHICARIVIEFLNPEEYKSIMNLKTKEK